ncbi:MAG: trypsin-like peptidase domain-containing protein [Opitutales bacterium]|nr:trypsin-like peptidase domain-containing protein [Opitutales bacterium]
MRRGFARFPGWCAFLAILIGFPFPVSADFLGLQRRIIEIYQENRSAMVRVKAVYEAQGEETTPQVIIGTGFFISREGSVLTNTSIVDNASRESRPIRIWIEHDGVAFSADLIGSDHSANVALLRLNTLPREFRFLHLVDSADLPPVGTLVVRLSMPLEFDPTPELGMVTGHESRFGGRLFPCIYIRTSIPGSPGDGGSAYLDLNGRLIGLNVVSIPEIGATYVIPARAALRIREDLLAEGNVVRGWVGFEVREESSVRDGNRIVIAAITDTPAREGGLLAGDVIRQIGGYRIRSLDDLRNAMFYARVGQYLQIQVLRAGEQRDFSIRVAPRPADEPLEVHAGVGEIEEILLPASLPDSEDGEEVDPVELLQRRRP